MKYNNGYTTGTVCFYCKWLETKTWKAQIRDEAIKDIRGSAVVCRKRERERARNREREREKERGGRGRGGGSYL